MIKVAVVMGGYSDEYVISLKSGELIYNSFDDTKYEKYKVHILEEGWFVYEEGTKFPINKADFSFEKEGKTIHFEVIYNTIHGTPGEDGHLQAYWELLEIPYSGARFYQSALSFNKRDTLSVLHKFDIDKANSIYKTKGEELDYQEITKELGSPIFVKPNQSGSSLGVSRVTNEEEFSKALEFAFAEDHSILIESELKGREVQVGVITFNDKVTAIGSTEIISENAFFDYEAKYHGKSEEITPAKLTPELEQKLFKTAEFIYSKMGMTGFSRLDFIIEGEIPKFIEINTNPGMSPASIFPQQVNHSKFTLSELLDNEIQLALKQKAIWNE